MDQQPFPRLPHRRVGTWALEIPARTQVSRAALRGCVGGFVATIVMTVYRMPVFRALPPTAEFWARYVAGGEAEQYFIPGILLHFVYGTVAGGIYGVLVSFIDVETDVSRERMNLVAGLGYGLVLSVIGSRLIFVHVLGRELQAEHSMVFHVGHAIYGVTLGTFMASRERIGEVYQESERTRPPSEKQTSGRSTHHRTT